VLWDVDAPALEAASAQLAAKGTVAAFRVELTEEAQIRAASAETLGRFGKIDILINNAGITGGNGPAWEIEPQMWRRVIEVNLLGPYLTCRSIVPVNAEPRVWPHCQRGVDCRQRRQSAGLALQRF
jgi:3-oxoacyl-[acyl-carrier protein] reductase